MMNEAEKEGCKRILDRFSYEDLSSLNDTISKRQIKVNGRSETIKAILDYSASALELLRRKKVKRDVLFKYLADEKIIVPTSTDKAGLIRAVLKHWGTNVDNLDMDVEYDDDSTSDSTSATDLTPGNQLSKVEPQPGVSGYQERQTGTQAGQQRNSRAEKDRAQSAPQINVLVHQYHTVSNVHNTNVYSSTTHMPGSSFQNDSHYQNSGTNNIERIAAPHQGQNSHHSLPSGHLSANISQDIQCGDNMTCQTASTEHRVLGEKFAQWFYENLNSHNPDIPTDAADFGPQHFWNDASFVLHSYTPNHNEEKLEGSSIVAQRFLAFTKDEHLLFSPNLSREGIYVRSNPHGLVMILVCGTIHRQNDCLGLFQQVFGIVKDPRFDNNWKIKTTKLEVKTSQSTEIPKLPGNPEQLMSLTAV